MSATLALSLLHTQTPTIVTLLQFKMRVLSLLALASSVAAVQFTSPTANSTLTKGSNVEVTWSSVDTDAESFNM